MRSICFERSIPKILGTTVLKKVWPGAVFAASSPLRFADLPEPPLPGPRGLRLRNRICGVCASDLHLVFVEIDPMVHPAALPGYQRLYLGHEVVSEVVEVGPGVQAFAPGDRVVMKSRFIGPCCASMELEPPCPRCAEGSYSLCENMSALRGEVGVGGGWGDGYTCHESEVWRLPEALTDEQGVLLDPLACSLRGVLRRPPRAGERVMVLGCGMIGLAAIQAVRALQPHASVLAVARHPHQQELARSYGAELLEGDLFEAVAAATGAKVYTGAFNNRTMLGGVDVVYDCVGSGETLQQSLRLTRAGGAVVVLGVNLNRIKLDLTPVWHQEVDLIGVMTHGAETFEGETLCTYDRAAQLIGAGKIRTEGLITHRFPLEQYREAIRTAVDKRTGAIRVAITC